MTALLLLASLPLILAGAVVFTNAVEWLGRRLRLGKGAVGSLIAAIGTALPESVIPVVALIGGEEGTTEVAIGAIIGAPFVLSTVAMVVLGISALAYRRRRAQGRVLDADRATVRRDLGFFFVFFAAALVLGVGVPAGLRLVAAVLFVLAFVVFAYRTIRAGGQADESEELRPLYFDRSHPIAPATWRIVAQTLLGLATLVGGAELFVKGVLEIASGLELSPLVIALVLGPLITEIPEKLNSVVWVRKGDDTLAVGNVTGAMAFQSTVPVGIGLAFSDWQLDRFALAAGMIGLAGGALAFLTLARRKPIRGAYLLAWSALFAGFVLYATSA